MVLVTFPDAETAGRMADGLLARRLAACVQTLPIQSAYHWKGAVHRDSEVLALIKTQCAMYPEVEALIRSEHPYETPEIIMLPIATGFAGYLDWIRGETSGNPPTSE